MNNSKIVSTKKTNAIFLAIVLIAGTIAAISPSFIIKGANAQDQPYYGYNSYESEYSDKKYSSYEPRYGMDNNNYKKLYGEDSYEPTDYTDKNSYEPTTSYGNDKNYQKTYGNDNSYESQYQSYKPDYKPAYPSYGKDDRDKSAKDSSSKNVSLNKIKCINTNLNINGNNAGNVSIGNKGQGYLDIYPSYGSGYGSEGYSKQGKGFECIINNNNNNTNVVAGGGNATDGNVTDACEECFNANLTLAGIITDILELPGGISLFPVFPDISIGGNVMTIAQLCDYLEEQISEGIIPQTGLIDVIIAILERGSGISAGVSEESVDALYECLLDVDFG